MHPLFLLFLHLPLRRAHALRLRLDSVLEKIQSLKQSPSSTLTGALLPYFSLLTFLDVLLFGVVYLVLSVFAFLDVRITKPTGVDC